MSLSISTPSGDKFSAKPLLVIIGQLGCIFSMFAAVVYLQSPQLASLKRSYKDANKATLQQAHAQAKIQLAAAKTLPTLGFRNIVADWYFIDFVQYFGDEAARKQTGYALALDYFDIIVDRDPRFLYAYYYLSATGSLYAGQPERSVGLMAKGLSAMTPKIPARGYYIWRLKSTDELLFLGKVPDAQRSMETAIEWASQYDDPDSKNAIRASQRTVNYLKRNPKSKQAQFSAWNMVLSNAPDRQVIKRAIGEIRALGGKVSISPTGEFKIEAPAGD
jgi:tetratricopeptide (TPR) repeat protein